MVVFMIRTQLGYIVEEATLGAPRNRIFASTNK